MMTGRTIDVAFVEEVLANVLRANQRRISIDEIQTQVAEHYRIRKAEMTSARRAREVARPRQVAMYLSKQLTPKSLARHRPALRRSRPHDGHPCGPADREAARQRCRARCRHPPADPAARGLIDRSANSDAQSKRPAGERSGGLLCAFNRGCSVGARCSRVRGRDRDLDIFAVLAWEAGEHRFDQAWAQCRSSRWSSSELWHGHRIATGCRRCGGCGVRAGYDIRRVAVDRRRHTRRDRSSRNRMATAEPAIAGDRRG